MRPRGVVGLVLVACTAASCTAGTPVARKTTSPTDAPAADLPSHVASCTDTQLAFTYQAGGALTGGGDSGRIIGRNTGPGPCLLAGSLTVTPLDASGHSVQTFKPLPPGSIPGQAVLSPNTPALTDGGSPTPGSAMVAASFWGQGLIDPVSGQTCSTADVVTPASWRLTASTGSWVVANSDPAGPDRFKSLYACRADFLGPVQVQVLHG